MATSKLSHKEFIGRERFVSLIGILSSAEVFN